MKNCVAAVRITLIAIPDKTSLLVDPAFPIIPTEYTRNRASIAPEKASTDIRILDLENAPPRTKANATAAEAPLDAPKI